MIKKYQMNSKLKIFVNNLGIVFFFRIVSATINLLAIVYATRIMGIEAVGKINLVQSISYFIVLPVSLGLNYSIIKYYPLYRSKERDQFMGTLVSSCCVITVCITLFYMLLSNFFSKIFHISKANWFLAIIMMISINMYTIIEAILRSNEKFKEIGIYKFISTIVFFIILIMFTINISNYKIFILAVVFHQLLFCILSKKYMVIKGKLCINKEIGVKILKFGAVNMCSQIICFILFSTDILLVNYFCPEVEVGVFALYQINVKNFFNIIWHEVFAVVFLPAIAKLDKLSIFRKIIKILPIILIFSFFMNFCLSLFMLVMYGYLNNIIWKYVILISIELGIHSIVWIFNYIFIIDGKKGAVMCLKVLGIPMPFLILINILAVKCYSISGLLYSLIFMQIILIISFMINIYRNFIKGEELIWKQV